MTVRPKGEILPYYHGNLATRAELLIEAIESGKITSRGILRAWVSSASSLPPRLREHVFMKIEPSVGPAGISYLRGLVTEVVPA